jgi:hypothetical protein
VEKKIRCPQDVHRAADEVFPRSRLLAIRSSREPPTLEDITDGLIADVIAQIGQGARDVVVAPNRRIPARSD